MNYYIKPHKEGQPCWCRQLSDEPWEPRIYTGFGNRVYNQSTKSLTHRYEQLIVKDNDQPPPMDFEGGR
jgi:hypothetical protein